MDQFSGLRSFVELSLDFGVAAPVPEFETDVFVGASSPTLVSVMPVEDELPASEKGEDIGVIVALIWSTEINCGVSPGVVLEGSVICGAAERAHPNRNPLQNRTVKKNRLCFTNSPFDRLN